MRTRFTIMLVAGLVACSSESDRSEAVRQPVGRANTWLDHCYEKCANDPKLECEVQPDKDACAAICGPGLDYNECINEANALASCVEGLEASELECDDTFGAVPRGSFCQNVDHDLNACKERVREGGP